MTQKCVDNKYFNGETYFSYKDFRDIIFKNCNLDDFSFYNCTFSNVKFKNCNFTNATIESSVSSPPPG